MKTLAFKAAARKFILLIASVLGTGFAGNAISQVVSISDALDDDRRAIVTELLFNANGTVEFVDAFVTAGPPRGFHGDPWHVRIEYRNVNGDLLGSRGTWDPRVQYVKDDEGNDVVETLPEVSGSFSIAFDKRIAELRFLKHETVEELIVVDVSSIIEDFCSVNPLQPYCDDATYNLPPVADIGGSQGEYDVHEGETEQLDGSDSSDPDGDAISFRWDLDEDGVFGESGAAAAYGDETGETPVFDATDLAALDPNGFPVDPIAIALEVCDTFGVCDVANGEVRVQSEFPPPPFGCFEEPFEDSDGDGICDEEDFCPLDPDNDADGDGQCGDVDVCPLDPDNDADGDGECGNVDVCPLDPDNDADGDGECGNVDVCPLDPDNDADGDGECGNVDVCPLDPDNDADGDSICGEIDNCPANPNSDQADSNDDGIGDACQVQRVKCDLDADGDVDRNDISVIISLRGTNSPPGNTLADFDDNGVISVTDARSCVLRCTLPRCTVQ